MRGCLDAETAVRRHAEPGDLRPLRPCFAADDARICMMSDDVAAYRQVVLFDPEIWV